MGTSSRSLKRCRGQRDAVGEMTRQEFMRPVIQCADNMSAFAWELAEWASPKSELGVVALMVAWSKNIQHTRQASACMLNSGGFLAKVAQWQRQRPQKALSMGSTPILGSSAEIAQ